MKILFIGDIFSNTGIRAIKNELSNIKKKYNIDYVIANAENVTNCSGLSIDDYYLLCKIGIDFFTMGNHTWKQPNINKILENKNIIRPANILLDHEFNKYGCGSRIVYINGCSIRITNLLGLSVNFKNIQTNPFLYLKNLLTYDETTDFHIVDFHAEMTSEKNALFYAFNGKVSAIIGTHTHVQTADEKIKNNTAYITDVGSTGSTDGIIGANGEEIIKKYINQTKHYSIIDQGGKYQFCAVILDLDTYNKKVVDIQRIYIYESDSNGNKL